MKAMDDVEDFIERSGGVFTLKDLKKGQSMQFMTALCVMCMVSPSSLSTGFHPDDIIENIMDNRRWFNPSEVKTGIGRPHTCEGKAGYRKGGKRGKKRTSTSPARPAQLGQVVMDMPTTAQKNAIRGVLQFNVINMRDWQTSSTRKKDNSVFVNNWCDQTYYEEKGMFRFSGDLKNAIEASIDASMVCRRPRLPTPTSSIRGVR